MTTYGEIGYTSDKLDEVYRSVLLAAQGAVPCVGRNCPALYIPNEPHSGHAERVQCSNPKCLADFCSLCKQTFHHGTSCDEMLTIASEWVRFMASGHDSLLVAAVKVDEVHYGPLLKAHMNGHKKNSVVKEAFDRFKELKKMEEWKVRNHQ